MDTSQKELVALAYAKMPFGKYKDRFLSHIPESYFIWFQRNGFPKGKLGNQMKQVYELKINGLEHLLQNIREQYKPE